MRLIFIALIMVCLLSGCADADEKEQAMENDQDKQVAVDTQDYKMGFYRQRLRALEWEYRWHNEKMINLQMTAGRIEAKIKTLEKEKEHEKNPSSKK